MAANTNFTAYTVDMYEFEKNFDHDEFHRWIAENWTLSFWYAVVYVGMVFGGRYYMENRPRFELRLPLVVWSGILAIFSIFGAIRTVPELVYVIRKYGFESSVCNPSYFYGPTSFWVYAFTISKAYELGDTAFIVLRKQSLIFLHWYHHVTVFIYVWHSYMDHTAPARWFMVMNYTVHSCMYTYYTLRAMRIHVPKFINIFITTLQISQMGLGLFVIIKAYQYRNQGHFCHLSVENMRFCFVMYTSYLLLFSYFFYHSYIKPKSTIGVKLDKLSNGMNQNGLEIKLK